MIFDYTDHKIYLKNVYLKRAAHKPGYSLTVMAKALGFAKSSFSEILRGKKNFSNEAAMRVAKRLNLNGAEEEYFCTLCQLEKTKSPEIREILVSRLNALRPTKQKRNSYDLSVDTFKLIADWYHLAILELCSLDPPITLSPHTASQKLEISLSEAGSAIDRLHRLGLLSKEANGFFRRNTENLWIESDHSNEALKKFHTQMIEKAMKSLEMQTPKERLIRSKTFGLNPELLPKADEIMEEYFSKIEILSLQSKSKKYVYHLSNQMFKISK